MYFPLYVCAYVRLYVIRLWNYTVSIVLHSILLIQLQFIIYITLLYPLFDIADYNNLSNYNNDIKIQFLFLKNIYSFSHIFI